MIRLGSDKNHWKLNMICQNQSFFKDLLKIGGSEEPWLATRETNSWFGCQNVSLFKLTGIKMWRCWCWRWLECIKVALVPRTVTRLPVVCGLWSPRAALSLLRAALHAPSPFHIVVLIISILLQRGDMWNIFPQNDVVVVYCLKHLSTWLFDTNSFAFVAPWAKMNENEKILIYALGLICQVMRCVGHDLRPRSTMRVTEQYIGGALGAYGKMIARKS